MKTSRGGKLLYIYTFNLIRNMPEKQNLTGKGLPVTQPFFQVLSLDITIGTLAVGLFAVHLFGVTANPVWWIILPLAVWTVYTADHLADGYRQKENSNIYRHDFHYRYRKILIPLIAITGISAGVLALVFLEPAVIRGGLILSAMILLYLLLLFFSAKKSNFYFHKELFIAFAYTAGIFLAPLAWYGKAPCFSKILPIIILFLLAWVESVMVSFFDYEDDLADGNTSFSLRYGKKQTRKILITVIIISAILMVLSVLFLKDQMSVYAVVIELLMLTILFVIIYTPRSFQENNIYRWIGELVFWLPALLFVF